MTVISAARKVQRSLGRKRQSTLSLWFIDVHLHTIKGFLHAVFLGWKSTRVVLAAIGPRQRIASSKAGRTLIC